MGWFPPSLNASGGRAGRVSIAAAIVWILEFLFFLSRRVSLSGLVRAVIVTVSIGRNTRDLNTFHKIRLRNSTEVLIDSSKKRGQGRYLLLAVGHEVWLCVKIESCAVVLSGPPSPSRSWGTRTEYFPGFPVRRSCGKRKRSWVIGLRKPK